MKILKSISATEINSLHVELLGMLHTSIQKAIEIGELLTLKKAELQHGEWGKWIGENLIFSDRTARNYMNIYENKERAIQAGSITEAYRMLSTPKTETVSIFKDFIPARNSMSVLITSNPKCHDIYIFHHETAGYYRMIWFEDDNHGGISVNGDTRGVNEAGLLIGLTALLKNTKDVKCITVSEDNELKQVFKELIA